ncbi:MAG: NAD(P)/FAD-dependent oxidoreductase [Arcobacter sp.]|jgi:NADH dehydrogenase|uniref:NAD(P)/FAD-dependent oxidoreductase n=1 Tax=unclassified Arcobacter TaxID=2593671 RepID=UPI0002295BC1|nr:MULTISPECIES: FAD-dependent oxidoreductase [unclassified Arcobacter]MDY3200180.1 FAD-dependent oxidoreductase [Arcobacter sp.]BAK71979.1 NADH dehydrogenase [Arcobacter sp. L]
MKRVIIIGASYAGLYAVKKFSKYKNVEVLLFDKNDYHYIQVESYGFVSTTYDISDVTIDINKYINSLNTNIKFHKEKVEFFDSDLKEIVTSNNMKYSYDYLIIATGALTNFPIQVPNIQKYSVGIKTLQSASKVVETFNSLINKKVYLNNEPNEFNIVIGGAGLSGVEIAAQMAALIKDKFSNFINNNFKINIIIVDGMKTVLPNMDERLVEACNKRLEELDIKIYLGSFIKDVDENKIYLTNETIVEYDYFIFTGGIKAVNIKSNKDYEINKLNQYVVNKNLQLKDENDIFVIGDAAQIMSDDKYLAPTAQLAIQSGEYVSTYIHNELSYKYTDEFSAKLNGVLISLGGNYAIGLIYNKYFVDGYFAHLIKKFVTYSHKIKFI